MRIIIATFVLLAACGLGRQPNYYSVNPDGTRSERYSRVNEYSSYGPAGLGQQQQIAAAYEDAQHAPPPKLDVEIFNSSLPPGVKLSSGAIEIEKGAPYEAVGRFEIGYWLQSAPQETDVKDDLVRLASVTHGNVVVVEVQRVAHADPRVNYLVGVVLRKRAAPGEVTATRPHVRAKLDYRASARGCLSAAEFADEVSARLGYSPWAADASLQLRAQIAERAGTFHATLHAPGGDLKELTGSSCRMVTDAAIAVLVVRLDEAVP